MIAALLKVFTFVGATFLFTFVGELLKLPCTYVVGIFLTFVAIFTFVAVFTIVGDFFYICGSFYICGVIKVFMPPKD